MTTLMALYLEFGDDVSQEFIDLITKPRLKLAERTPIHPKAVGKCGCDELVDIRTRLDRIAKFIRQANNDDVQREAQRIYDHGLDIYRKMEKLVLKGI